MPEYAQVTAADAPTPTEPARKKQQRERPPATSAGLTNLGIDAMVALAPDAAPYGSRFDLAARSTGYGFGTNWVSVGIDVDLGFALADTGFAYGFGLRVGPGHWFSDNLALGVYTGIGLDGVTESVPFALRAPAGAGMQVNLLAGLSMSLRVETGWDFATTRTGGGTPGPDFVRSILDVGFARRTAATDEEMDFNLVLGVQIEQIADDTFVGLHLGTGVSTNPW